MNDFQLLGLSSSANKEDVQKAFRKLAMVHHPDKGGDAKKFALILDARNRLMKRFEFTGTSSGGVHVEYSSYTSGEWGKTSYAQAEDWISYANAKQQEMNWRAQKAQEEIEELRRRVARDKALIEEMFRGRQSGDWWI